MKPGDIFKDNLDEEIVQLLELTKTQGFISYWWVKVLVRGKGGFSFMKRGKELRAPRLLESRYTKVAIE